MVCLTGRKTKGKFSLIRRFRAHRICNSRASAQESGFAYSIFLPLHRVIPSFKSFSPVPKRQDGPFHLLPSCLWPSSSSHPSIPSSTNPRPTQAKLYHLHKAFWMSCGHFGTPKDLFDSVGNLLSCCMCRVLLMSLKASWGQGLSHICSTPLVNGVRC